MTRVYGVSEKTEKKASRGWLFCVLLALASLVVIGAILVFLYRREVVAVAQSVSAANTVRGFVEQQAPALQRDFPFQPGSPGALDSERFLRYCTARSAIGAAAGDFLDKIAALHRVELPRTNDPRQILQAIGAERVSALASSVENLTPAVERALRQNRLSVEEFRWIAAQVWGQVAQAAQRGDAGAKREIAEFEAQMAAQFGVRLPERQRDQFTQRILESVGPDYTMRNPAVLWPVITRHWPQWAGNGPGRLTDVALVYFWKDIQQGARQWKLR